MQNTCQWTEIDMWKEKDCVEVFSYWRTTCGESTISKSPSQHKFKYCPYCGKLISKMPQLEIPQPETPQLLEGIKNYLDNSIHHWRNQERNQSTIARYYIDAYQSVRMSIFGELFPLSKEDK